MSLLADAAQPHFIRGIQDISGRLELITIPDVLAGERAAYVLEFDDAARTIHFDFGNPTFVAQAAAADCCRLSASAFQTITQLEDSDVPKEALPWSMIRLYYAAFYAGHTIVRLLGETCSFFDQRHTSRILALAKAIDKVPSFKVESGMYRCSIDASATRLSCLKIGSSSGGSHESFWAVFGSRIQTLASDVLTGPMTQQESQTVFAQLEAFDRLIARHGSYKWLSTFRNEIQYKQAHGTWFPCTINARERKALARLCANWKTDPMKIDLDSVRFGELGEFTTACAFIMSFCRELTKRIAERAPIRNRSFLQFGPIAFLNGLNISLH